MKGTGAHWPSTSWSPTTARSDMTSSQETILTLCLAVNTWQVHFGIYQHQESRSFVSIEHLTSYATWTAMNSYSLHFLMTSPLSGHSRRWNLCFQTLTISLLAFANTITTNNQYRLQVMAEEEPMGWEFSERWWAGELMPFDSFTKNKAYVTFEVNLPAVPYAAGRDPPIICLTVEDLKKMPKLWTQNILQVQAADLSGVKDSIVTFENCLEVAAANDAGQSAWTTLKALFVSEVCYRLTSAKPLSNNSSQSFWLFVLTVLLGCVILADKCGHVDRSHSPGLLRVWQLQPQCLFMRRGRWVGQRLPVVPVVLQALRPCGAGLLKSGSFGKISVSTNNMSWHLSFRRDS